MECIGVHALDRPPDSITAHKIDRLGFGIYQVKILLSQFTGDTCQQLLILRRHIPVEIIKELMQAIRIRYWVLCQEAVNDQRRTECEQRQVCIHREGDVLI